MESLEKAKILIVDDVAEKRLAIEVILEELGQTVVSARSGGEALRCLLNDDFAVILLDVNMPDMCGHETAALIRKRKKSRHTPIIFITAFADDVQAAEGYALGAVDYILSPVVPEILRAKVKVFVDLHQMRAELARSHALLELRVEERTAELERTAEILKVEVSERKRAEERLSLLVSELTHRAKNLLAVVQSVLHLSQAETMADFIASVDGRIRALSRAHSLLSEARWQNVDLGRIVAEEIAPFTSGPQQQIVAHGPPVSLHPASAQSLALALHELVTNAVKYGTSIFLIATIAIVLQVIFNLEAIRYTLYTGEPIYGGIMRLKPGPRFWAAFYAFMGFFQLGWPALAGSARLPYPKFLLFNVIGGVTWVVTFTLGGYFAGEAFEHTAQLAGRGLAIGLAAAAVIALTVWGVRKHRREAREEALSEAGAAGGVEGGPEEEPEPARTGP